jgi:mono/diheme cytochrome c family protein
MNLAARVVLIATTLLCACNPGTPAVPAGKAQAAPAPVPVLAAPASARAAQLPAPAGPATRYPILFVTQVPVTQDRAARLSAFANHLTGVDQVPRGGDLVLRYPDGSLRNLTREAGYGLDGAVGPNAIAVREPSVHWSGERALFSMLVGAPSRPGQAVRAFWQIFEASGLARGETVRIARVPGQPAAANNVSPLYAPGGRILFTSDQPRSGAAHLYPQLDEYEATPTITGIWSLDPASGACRILNHTPSGAFGPIVDSYGRIVFTRWDHLQQDQLAQRDRDALGNGVALPFRSFDYAGEAPADPALASRDEPFPESRSGSTSPYGPVSAWTMNFFTAWQMNEDGSGEETLNHVGQHELAFGYLTPSFTADPALSSRTADTLHANRLALRRETGLFHLREDPRRPGAYYATAAREHDAFTTGQLLRLDGQPSLNGEQVTLTAVTAGDPGDALAGGRFRNPLPLADGTLVASHSSAVRAPEPGQPLPDLRLVRLVPERATGLLRAGEPLTAGIVKSLSWPVPGGGTRTWAGPLWELEAVELRARPLPPARVESALEAPERAVLAEERVSEDELRAWLRRHDLALVVTRDQTSRDRADLQQPFSLRVPGGKQTVSTASPTAKVYDIAHFQLFAAQQLRAYPGRPGRRVVARPLAAGANPPDPGGPAGSVRIAPDGSTAAFVPARRALTWQTTDAQGAAIVRERNWITFQAGEMRVCASCHGVNARTQAGVPPPVNRPEALRALLAWWKTLPREGNMQK